MVYFRLKSNLLQTQVISIHIDSLKSKKNKNKHLLLYDNHQKLIEFENIKNNTVMNAIRGRLDEQKELFPLI